MIPHVPHSYSENYREFLYHEREVYSKCVVCFGRLEISPQPANRKDMAVGHEEVGAEKKIQIAHLVHLRCMQLLFHFRGQSGCQVCNCALSFEDLRMVTFQIDRRRKLATSDSIVPVSPQLWAAVEEDCGPYEASPPDSIVRPESILEVARQNKRAELEEMIESWIEIPAHVWREAVYCAADSGSMAVIELFLEKEAVLGDDPVWSRALYHAAQSGQLPVVALLLERERAQMEDFHVKNSLRVAVANGYLGICKLLFQYCKNQIPYYNRVEACTTWGSEHSTVEELLFLLGGENFDLYSRIELRRLMKCLDEAFGEILSQDINPNAIRILRVVMQEMKRREKSLPILQEWLDMFAFMDREYRLLRSVLHCQILVRSKARRIFIKKVFEHGDWHWGNPRIVAHPSIRLSPSVEVTLGEVLHPDALALLPQIPQDVANPNVHFLLGLRKRWQTSWYLAVNMLFAPGPPMSRADRGELLYAALGTKNPEIVQLVLQSGEVFPGDWKKSRRAARGNPDIGALLDKHRQRSIRLFFMEYWHRFSSWISRKWHRLYWNEL